MSLRESISRRRLLALLASGVGGGLALGARRALALGEPAVGIARMSIPDLPDPRPGAFVDLLREVERNSSVRPDFEVPEVDPASGLLFEQPFVTLTGDRWFEPLPDEAVANLRLYLRDGGFLFVDDASGIDDSDFDAAVRRDLARVLPGTRLGPVGRDHAIYRSFFLLRGVSGRILVRRHLEGMWLGDITPVLYSLNDLSGAWWRAPGGDYALDVVPGGRRQRTEATKLGINLVLFALTGNYKRDAVHVDALLKRMRRQGGYAE